MRCGAFHGRHFYLELRLTIRLFGDKFSMGALRFALLTFMEGWLVVGRFGSVPGWFDYVPPRAPGAALPVVPSGLTLKPETGFNTSAGGRARASVQIRLDIGELGSRIGRANLSKTASFHHERTRLTTPWLRARVLLEEQRRLNFLCADAF